MTLSQIRAALADSNEWICADMLLADLFPGQPSGSIPKYLDMRALLAHLIAELRLEAALQTFEAAPGDVPAIDACPGDVIAAVEAGLLADAQADAFATVEACVLPPEHC